LKVKIICEEKHREKMLPNSSFQTLPPTTLSTASSLVSKRYAFILSNQKKNLSNTNNTQTTTSSSSSINPSSAAVQAVEWLRRTTQRWEIAPLKRGDVSNKLAMGSPTELVRIIGNIFSDPDKLGGCFPKHPMDLITCEDDSNTLETTDVKAIHDAMYEILSFPPGPGGPLHNSLGHAFRSLTASLMVSQYFFSFSSVHFRALLIAWEIACISNQYYQELNIKSTNNNNNNSNNNNSATTITTTKSPSSPFDPVQALRPLVRWPKHIREMFVLYMQKNTLFFNELQEGLSYAVKKQSVVFAFEYSLPINLCLDILWQHRVEFQLEEKKFINPDLAELCADVENQFLDGEFVRWQRNIHSNNPIPDSFYQMAYVLDTPSKEQGLHNFTFNQQQRESRATAMMGLGEIPVFVMHVRRDNLVGDTLAIMQQSSAEDWKKVLRVHFEGEEGVDAGGVRKEYFLLMMSQLLDPAFSMFAVQPNPGILWFNPDALENANQFKLVGALMGLAIYNRVILNLPFPPFLYAYLLGEIPTSTTTNNESSGQDIQIINWWLKSLSQVDNDLSQSLTKIVNYNNNNNSSEFQIIFGELTFEVSRESWGEIQTFELIPNGKNISVTLENRYEFVRLYCQWRLVNACIQQIEAFKKGFVSVMDVDTLHKLWIRPDELELLVVGVQTLDFKALEESTRYDDGFDENSPTIKTFWKVLHNLDDEAKRKFLFFVTGSDRVPVRGLSDIRLVISRNGPDSDQLPTSHTCFNHLLLPDYGLNEIKMMEKLKIALANAEGFGSR
jgi:hypothetical protein